MSLAAGTRLGPYEIESLLGVGGMGEVYRANDTRLDRVVAIKVLPDGGTDDAANRARFHREAKVISALSHAHICALHDVGHDAGVEYLVLELLQGETLAARLARGPLAISQVVRLGSQMAAALAAAHRHGIVHRDLKPANIMLTPAGVKLLDFGLAKPVQLLDPSALAATMVGAGPATTAGSIVGTLQYMAPEQVQGLAVDARTDIFALGAVLHEMVTGHRAFGGASQAHVIASILNADPPPITTLVPLAPPALAQLIDRCLAKDPADRWHSAHDVQLQLEWLQSHVSGVEPTAPVPPARRRWRLPLAAGVAGAVLTAAPLLLVRTSSPSAGSVPMRFDLVLPATTQLGTQPTQDVPEISPDGRWLAYSALVGGSRQLVLRDWASHEAKVLAGGEGATLPFWSPDSRSIGFFAGDLLKRISITGGAQVLAPAPQGAGGGAWKAGLILYSAFGMDAGRLHSIPDTGGKPTLVETLPRGPGIGFDVRPQFLPDGTSFLVGVSGASGEDALYVGSLETAGRQRVLATGGRLARYTQGFLLYSQSSRLFARAFDPARHEFRGPEVWVSDAVTRLSAARDGTVVYYYKAPVRSRLAWYSRGGIRGDTMADADQYMGMTLSPSGRRAAVWKPDAAGNTDIWDVDLASGIVSRMTTNPASDSDAAWSPESRRMAFSSHRAGRLAVYVKDIASGREELITQVDGLRTVVDGWTPDGRSLVVRTIGRGTYLVPVDGERTPRLLWEDPFVKDEYEVSPDGRWVAFNSNESGEWEVYVATFPGHASKRRVSSAGGVQPHWRGDGRELFYLGRDSSMMSVPITPGNGLETGRPVTLFSTDIEPNPNLPQYGVTRDGQRFLGLSRGEPDREQFTVLLNWLTPEHLFRR